MVRLNLHTPLKPTSSGLQRNHHGAILYARHRAVFNKKKILFQCKSGPSMMKENDSLINTVSDQAFRNRGAAPGSKRRSRYLSTTSTTHSLHGNPLWSKPDCCAIDSIDKRFAQPCGTRRVRMGELVVGQSVFKVDGWKFSRCHGGLTGRRRRGGG